MEGDKWPLSDLSFFRVPDLTPDVVRNIALLLLLLALTVLATVLLQRWVQGWYRRRHRRTRFARAAGEPHMAPHVRAVLERLMRHAGAKDEFAFVHDALAFESAVADLAEQADDATLGALATLRRTLHLNAMNAEVQLVSTRQLLADLPVRVVANIGPERLDLYCTLLTVDERHLLIDLPPHAEIHRLLEAHPHVYLLYWREPGGEAVFRLVLEPIPDGNLPVFRAPHAFRAPDAEHRSAFRLSLDEPASYQFLERHELGRRVGRGGEAPPVRQGEGRVLDVSYGGASVVVDAPLDERGLAQLQFRLHGQPVRLMLEVLSREALTDGRWLVRGQFRGLGAEARVRLNNVLYREQIKRLREKDVLHIRAGG